MILKDCEKQRRLRGESCGSVTHLGECFYAWHPVILFLIGPICRKLSQSGFRPVCLRNTDRKLYYIYNLKDPQPYYSKERPISASGIQLLSWIGTPQIHRNAISQILQSHKAVLWNGCRFSSAELIFQYRHVPIWKEVMYRQNQNVMSC